MAGLKKTYQLCEIDLFLSFCSTSAQIYLFIYYFYCIIFYSLKKNMAQVSAVISNITKTRVFKYIENFTTKNWKFSDKKKKDIFSYFCSKDRLWYSLEPPRRGGSNEFPQSIFWAEIRKIMYIPVNPSLRGCKVVKII